MRPRMQDSEAGYSLIELLVACAAALILLGATFALLESSVGVQARDTEWALTLQEDRAGLAQMVHDIRQASKVEETTSSKVLFLATMGGKRWEVKYECAVAQPGTAYDECVRLAAAEGTALPSTGPAVVRDVLNGTAVFAYSPSSAAPIIATAKLELPAKGTLRQANSSAYAHKTIVLEDAAFMRNLYPQG